MMYATHLLTIAGVLSAGIAAPRPQDPPPPPPPVQTSAPVQTAPPQTPVQAPPPTQAPASQAPVTQAPAAPAPAAAPPPPAPLTESELRQRRDAIYLFEGLLIKAVQLAAQHTVTEIRRIEPGIVMFSASPVKAHGTYLEGFGVFFHVEIPSVIPSVAWAVETLARGRTRPDTSPAQPTSISSTGAPNEPMLDPNAHYVQSVKDQLITAIIRQSNSMDLRPDEWLAIEARDGSETPGQLSQPSTMTLRIKGSDLADFFAGRITIEEARKRVQVRGF
jgi:hypothetical protein